MLTYNNYFHYINVNFSHNPNDISSISFHCKLNSYKALCETAVTQDGGRGWRGHGKAKRVDTGCRPLPRVRPARKGDEGTFLCVLLSIECDCPVGLSALGLMRDVFIITSLIPFNSHRQW